MKTRRDYSIAVSVFLVGLAFYLPALFAPSFLAHPMGKLYSLFILLFVFVGILKIEQIVIEGNVLTKYNFIFKRSLELDKITRFKIESRDTRMVPEYNFFSFWRKSGGRYSNWRFLVLYTEGRRKMKIDERTMPLEDFKKLIAVIKRNKK